MPRERRKNMNVKVTEVERRKLHALAEDRGLSASDLLRMHIADLYRQRFGAAEPPASKDGAH